MSCGRWVSILVQLCYLLLSINTISHCVYRYSTTMGRKSYCGNVCSSIHPPICIIMRPWWYNVMCLSITNVLLQAVVHAQYFARIEMFTERKLSCFALTCTQVGLPCFCHIASYSNCWFQDFHYTDKQIDRQNQLLNPFAFVHGVMLFLSLLENWYIN